MAEAEGFRCALDSRRAASSPWPALAVAAGASRRSATRELDDDPVRPPAEAARLDPPSFVTSPNITQDPSGITYFDEAIFTPKASRAAHMLSMSQPAVSMALRKLRTIFDDHLWSWENSQSFLKLSRIGNVLSGLVVRLASDAGWGEEPVGVRGEDAMSGAAQDFSDSVMFKETRSALARDCAYTSMRQTLDRVTWTARCLSCKRTGRRGCREQRGQGRATRGRCEHLSKKGKETRVPV
jgi:hypothetical protein